MKPNIPHRIFVPVTMMLLILMGSVFAHEESSGSTLPPAGTTPDKFSYIFDILFDRISLLLTFDAKQKALKSLAVERERLSEANEMIEQGKLNYLESIEKEYANAARTAASAVSKLKSTDTMLLMGNVIGIEKELEEHEIELKTVSGRLIDATRDVSAASVLENMLIENKKTKSEVYIMKTVLRERLLQETGRPADVVDSQIGEMEFASGLTVLKIDRAVDAIEDARNEITRAKYLLSRLNSSFDVTSVNQLLFQSDIKMYGSVKALNETGYDESFAQAASARMLADDAIRQLGEILEKGEKLDSTEEITNESSDDASQMQSRPSNAVAQPSKPFVVREFILTIDHGGMYFSPNDNWYNRIRVDEGQIVKIYASSNNPSHHHGFTIDEYGINTVVTSPETIVFEADKPGTFRIWCKPCLDGPLGDHPWVQGTLVVEKLK